MSHDRHSLKDGDDVDLAFQLVSHFRRAEGGKAERAPSNARASILNTVFTSVIFRCQDALTVCTTAPPYVGVFMKQPGHFERS